VNRFSIFSLNWYLRKPNAYDLVELIEDKAELEFSRALRERRRVRRVEILIATESPWLPDIIPDLVESDPLDSPRPLSLSICQHNL
jgi:hypothetical protein